MTDTSIYAIREQFGGSPVIISHTWEDVLKPNVTLLDGATATNVPFTAKMENGVLTLTVGNTVQTITFPQDSHLQGATYDSVSDTLTLTLTDGTSFPVPLADLVKASTSGTAIAGDGTAGAPIRLVIDPASTAGVVSQSATGLKVTIPATTHTNTWTKAGGLAETVNGVASNVTIAGGVIADVVGYNAAGAVVYQSLASLPINPSQLQAGALPAGVVVPAASLTGTLPTTVSVPASTLSGALPASVTVPASAITGVLPASALPPTTHTMAWTKTAGVSSVVNGVTATKAIAAGTIADVVGYDATGAVVYQTLSSLPINPSQLQPGALPSGVSVPSSSLTGPLPASVSVPASAITGVLPASALPPTTNTLVWSKASGVVSTVNGTVATKAVPVGVVNEVVGYDAAGNVVSQVVALPQDFWRSAAGGTTLPDGTGDVTENIRRNGAIGLNVDPLTTSDIAGSHSFNVTTIPVTAAPYVVTALDSTIYVNATVATSGSQEIQFPAATAFPRRIITVVNPTSVVPHVTTITDAANGLSQIGGQSNVILGNLGSVRLDARSVESVTYQSINGVWRVIDLVERQYYTTRDYASPATSASFNSLGIAATQPYIIPNTATAFTTLDGNFVNPVTLPAAKNATGRFSVYCSSAFNLGVNVANTDLPSLTNLSSGESLHFEWSNGLWRWVPSPEVPVAVSATTNTLTANQATGFVSVVNGVTSTLPVATGTVAQSIGFDAAGNIVRGVAAPPQTPFVANDSNTIDFTTSGADNHTLTGAVKISATAGNRIVANADGLFSAAIPVTTNALTITAGGGVTSNVNGVNANVPIPVNILTEMVGFNAAGVFSRQTIPSDTEIIENFVLANANTTLTATSVVVGAKTTITVQSLVIVLANDLTITLPPAASVPIGVEIDIKTWGIRAGITTIVGSGGQNIDSRPSYIINKSTNTTYPSVSLRSLGSQWIVV